MVHVKIYLISGKLILAIHHPWKDKLFHPTVNGKRKEKSSQRNNPNTLTRRRSLVHSVVQLM